MSAGVKVIGGGVHTGAAGRRAGRLWLYGIVAALALLGLATFIAALAVSGGSSADTVPIAQAGPTRLVGGLPSGYPDTPRGAEAAAARFTLLCFGVLDGHVAAQPRQIAALYATAAYRETLTRLLEVTRARSEAHAAQLARAVIRRSVFATRLVTYTRAQATVETWELAIVMVGHPPVLSSQLIQRFELAWARADWRIADASDAEAPLEGGSEAQRAQVLAEFSGPGDASAGY